LEKQLVPMQNHLESINTQRTQNDHSFPALKDNIHISEKILKRSIQTLNLLKVLNKNQSLENLQSIDEVYEGQADMVDEVLYYHQYKDRLNKNTANINESLLSDDSKFGDMNDDISPGMDSKIKNLNSSDSYMQED
jgi:hypothetical protein